MEAKGLKALRVSLASPETIKSWSYGEVLKPETINYRRLRPEKDGLFCEAIFGPQKDWQCYCGKYKNQRYKGIVCDKCGVEVTRSSVRRERMGHITLAAPVAHVWYSRRVPSYMGLILDISRKNLDRVLYFAQYVVTHVDEDTRKRYLERIDNELASLDNDINARLNVQIADLQVKYNQSSEQLKTQIKKIEEKYSEELAIKLAPVIKEGQNLESKLRDDSGKAPRKDIKFSDEEVVVKAGEEIATKHIARVQEIVKEYLNSFEIEVAERKERELKKLEIEKDELKAEFDTAVSNLRLAMEDEISIERAEKKRMRDEILDIQPLTFLGEPRYRELRSRWGQLFKADMGAEAFQNILSRLDLDKMSKELWTEVRTTKSKQKRKKATKRLKVVEAFRRSGNRPEWMILSILPVIPPDLRPMVQLDGGRFATSDLNDLYRRVINRNNRLKRLLELGAPDVIVRNEKRMLQEAVDSLIDNSQRGKVLSRRGKRELRSLSDLLKGKKGRFRRNLLGKRVDYSGRSVIVVGPQLKLYQCGLPKSMALELYRPFVAARLVSKNYVANVKGAKRAIDRNSPEVWEVLEEVIGDRPVLLNRAPTLHRLGIQAFEPLLVEGSAIHLHPLVTTAFNADFDGDQMAVHVPLSRKAVDEARALMLSSKNLLKPADGEPIIGPSKDMVLGCYYLTMRNDNHTKGDGRVFGSMDEVAMAYQLDQVDIHSNIKIYGTTWYHDYKDEKGKDRQQRLTEPVTRMIDTTVGRVLFNRSLVPEVNYLNRALDKGGVKDLIAELFEFTDEDTTTQVADKIKDIGFKYATRSGITIAISDITIPERKDNILDEAMENEQQLEDDYAMGLITSQKQDELKIEIWQKATDDVAEAVKDYMDPLGNLATMANSGATKGGFTSISQLAGMRGMMADPSGRIIPMPIRSNFREGLTTLEYFISTHGQRKGLADTALRTADAGYLTRRLVDVAQDMIVSEADCGTEEGLIVDASQDVAGQSFGNRIYGRVTAERVIHPETGEVMFERNVMIDKEKMRQILDAGITAVKVRIPLTCESERGICAHCYGMDMGKGKLAELGVAVGIIAAQSIGEPGTQLTLRTFHSGGVASSADIITGLPRVEELFEARKMPKGEAVVTEIAGKVDIYQSEKYQDLRVVHILNSEMVDAEYMMPEGWTVNVESGTEVSAGDVLMSHGDGTINSEKDGKVRIEGDKIIVASEEKEEAEYEVPSNVKLTIKNGQYVIAGQQLSEGSMNPHTILKIQGREACYNYLLNEVQQVYRSQGQNIHDKHFEVIIRKMMEKVQITAPGDSEYLPGDMINRLKLYKFNNTMVEEGKAPARSEDILLGITKASLNTESFLSAASFQHTIKVLAQAAIAGAEDELHGLKENVIIGKLIPAGTGYEVMQERLLQEEKAKAAALAAENAASEDAIAQEYLDLDESAADEPVIAD